MHGRHREPQEGDGDEKATAGRHRRILPARCGVRVACLQPRAILVAQATARSPGAPRAGGRRRVRALAPGSCTCWSSGIDRLFDYPVVDEERYVAMARGLTLGYVEPRAWFHPPGLVYALSLVFRAFGDGLLAPRIVQACVSSATCLLAFVVARRFFSARVAIGAATVCAFHGLLIFESYELLPPTWIAATALVALWALDVAREKRTVVTALAAGVSLGVSAVFAPTILPFAACAALWLRRPALAVALVAGVAIPIAPVTAGNWERSHEIVLVSSNGGLNFFLGNNADYDATLAIRPGHRWETLMDEPARAGNPGARGRVPRLLHVEGARLLSRRSAGRRGALLARKLHLYFDGAELPRDTDIYAAREGSPLLSALVSRGPPWLPLTVCSCPWRCSALSSPGRAGASSSCCTRSRACRRS